MKTVHIVNRYYLPVAAGIEVSLREMFRHLDPAEYAITMHVSDSTLSHANSLPPSERIENVTVHRYPAHGNAFFPRIPYRQTDVLILTNFTLIPNLPILMYTLLLKIIRAKRFKLIVFPYGGFTPAWITFSRPRRIIKKAIHALVGRLLINTAADRIIAISPWEQNELVKSGLAASRMRHVPLAVEEIAFSPIEAGRVSSTVKKITTEKKPYIVQLARIHPIKNIDTTIRALSLIKEPLSYVIAGDVEDRQYFESLQKLVKKYGLEKRVVFAGNLNSEDKYFLIDRSLCMVHMAHCESFGIAVYEGMSQGKVCIAANNTALNTAVSDGKNGYLIETNDYRALADRLAYLMSGKSASAMHTIEKTNRSEMREYTWKRSADLLKQAIRD